MKSKKAKFYIYTDNGKDTIFWAYTKKDIRKYLGVTKYNIGINCWEESSFHINVYYDDAPVINLTINREAHHGNLQN